MADSNSDLLSFEGTSPKECELFVSTIRRRAFDQGKHRDNEWMAIFASSFFVGDAFYWYEGLDENTQNDWSRLRPALVARFGRGDLISTTTPSASSTPISAPFTTIPTPAAAPPMRIVPRPSVRKGHLKVLSSDGSLRGYLTKQLDENDSYSGLSGSVSDALLVSFTISSADKAFEIQIINASQHPQTSDVLAIAWPNLSGNKWMDGKWSAANCCSFLTVTSKSNRDWTIERNVWKISNKGDFSIEHPTPDGGTKSLYCFVVSTIFFRKYIPKECERGVSLERMHNPACALTEHPTAEDRF